MNSFTFVQVAVKPKGQKKSNPEAPTDAALAHVEAPATETEATTAAPDPASSFSQYLNFQNPSWDTFLFIFFLIAAFLYGVSLGRDRIIVILVSIYMALAVVAAMPNFVLDVTFNQNFAFQITAFISIFIILFFLLSRSALLNTIGQNATRGTLIEVFVFSFLHVGLLISISLGFLPADFIAKFSPMTQAIFLNEWSRFGWIAAPIVAMIVLGKRKEN